MTTARCPECKESFDRTHGLQKFCSRKCNRSYWNRKTVSYRKQWHQDNRDKINKAAHERYLANRDERLAYAKTPKNRKRSAELSKQPHRVQHRRDYLKAQRKTSPMFRLREAIKDRIRRDARLTDATDGRALKEKLGYELEGLLRKLVTNVDVQMWLEGKLELDHIIPLSLYTYQSTQDAEFKKAWHPDNLRLIPVTSNRRRTWATVNWVELAEQGLTHLFPLTPLDLMGGRKTK